MPEALDKPEPYRLEGEYAEARLSDPRLTRTERFGDALGVVLAWLWERPWGKPIVLVWALVMLAALLAPVVVSFWH